MRVCAFLASAPGQLDGPTTAAIALGRGLASRGWGLVYGGAGVGLMRVLADAALTGGGEVIGVIPQDMIDRELAHGGLTALHVVASMAARKQRMFELADAFVTLPGGFGTLDELFEALTLIQTGKIYQFPVIMFGRHYWAGLIRWLQSRVLLEKKISPGDMDLMLLTDDPQEAANAVIAAYDAQTRPQPKRRASDHPLDIGNGE